MDNAFTSHIKFGLVPSHSKFLLLTKIKLMLKDRLSTGIPGLDEVLHTGSVSKRAYQQESLAHGARSMLVKPLVIKELLRFMRSLLGEQV